MRVMLWFTAFCTFLVPSSSRLISCNVTFDGYQTAYIIIPQAPDGSGSHCEYTWSNASRHVLAHDTDQHFKLVKINTINRLVTSECLDSIIYERNCISEGEAISVYCNISCSWKPKTQTVQAEVTEPTKSPEPAEVTNKTTVVIIAVVIIAAVVISLVFVLPCIKFKDRICRHSCLYSAVKTDIPPAV